MFNNKYAKIRGEFTVTKCHCPVNLNEGLTREISVATETEFDIDIDIDEDFYACEKIIITFRASRAGWAKAYRRLRQQFKGRIRYCDQKPQPNLRARLRHKQLIKKFRSINHGVKSCA